MKAIHWLRSRQEERELTYWLSLVAYEKSDHSFTNRLYLLYLVLFFSAWVFVTLTFFASGGALLLVTIGPTNPGQAISLIELILLASWSLYFSWKATRRCPIIFAAEDGLIISQTPLNRAKIVFRWLWMPWVKSAIPFWLIAITLGFSYAELKIPGAIGANRFFEYSGFGLHAWLAVLPLHLILFVISWVIGVMRCSTKEKDHWKCYLVFGLLVLVFGVITFSFSNFYPSIQVWIKIIADILLSPFQIGFFPVFNWYIWLIEWGFIFLLFFVLLRAATRFSLSRAVQETHQSEFIHRAMQYGLNQVVAEQKIQQKLGVLQKPARIPAMEGRSALLWKTLLQTWRNFQLADFFSWLQIFGLMFFFQFLPDFGSRTIVLIVWVLLTAQRVVKDLRTDLSLWPIIKQLPISSKDFLLYGYFPTFLLNIIINLVGILLGSLLFGTEELIGLLLLFPGMIAAIFFTAGFDVVRNCHTPLLLNGAVPELGAGGILLAIIFSGAPILINELVPGIWGCYWRSDYLFWRPFWLFKYFCLLTAI